jgi:hypothetical protein
MKRGSVLPTEAFQLTHVWLRVQPELTDSGLEPFGGLTKLILFHVWNAPKLTDAGLVHLQRLTQLESLGLNGTRVTDDGLARLAGLVQLEELFLDGTHLTDAGLAHLQGMKQLRRLGLRGTRVTDAGLARLAGLVQLEDLAVGGTHVTDAGLAHLQGMKQLRGLGLYGTRVTDAGLARLAGLVQLEGLSLDETRVTDAGLAHLQGMKQLRGLGLNGTRITDAGLARVAGLVQLKELRLGRTRVTDAGLAHLRSLPQLKKLFLKATGVTPAGLEGLKASLPLCEVIADPAVLEKISSSRSTASSSGVVAQSPGMAIKESPGSTANRNADSTPEEVLKSRGLTLSGKLFVLEKEEAEFLRELDKVAPIYTRLEAQRNQLEEVLQHEAWFNELDNKRILTREALINLEADMAVMPSGGNNLKREAFSLAKEKQRALRMELSELVRVVALERKNLVPPGKKQARFNEFRNTQSEFLSASSGVRSLGEKVEKTYAELARDATIKQALNTFRLLSKTSVKLGPSPKFRDGMSQLKAAEKTLTPAINPAKTRAEDKPERTPKGKRDSPAAERGRGKGLN